MKSITIASITLAALLGLNAQAQYESQTTQASKQDTSFIQKAAQANLAEAQLGKLAAQKSQNTEVKQFAEHLQTDHQSANQKLQPIAQAQGVQFPQTPDQKQQREIDRLQKLSGAEFDKEFATTALQSHAETIALYQKEAQQGQNMQTKQYAQSMVPALQHHLSMAESVAKSVGVKESTISSILSRYPGAVGGAGSPGGMQHEMNPNQGGGGY